MRIAVLGPLEVRSDTGSPVAVPGAKERLLLALLTAGAPGAVGVDRLAESLWDGDPPPSARKSLQIHLVRLRAALDPQRPRGSPAGHVVRRGAGYALDVTAEELDALGVGELLARGRAQLAAGDAAGAERALTAALALWRGEPYEDWPDAAFAATERRRLAELRAAARTALSEARLALGRPAEVVGDLQPLVTEDPLREDWWRLLVLALYRSGRQGDALATLQRARRALAEELGADPGPQLRALETAVLAQDPVLDAPGDAAVPQGRPPARTCPYKGLAAYQATDAGLFRGRDRVVARLVARLVDAPLVVVSGASGTGKSSLVRAGLLPALAVGALPGSGIWSAVVLTPGPRPGAVLRARLADAPADRPVVLVCDQLEELWAPRVDADERAAFLDALLALLDDGRVVRCVVVLRGDAVGRLAEHAALAERLGAALVLVPPMTAEELREVVDGPAAAVGLTSEPDLVDAVVADVAGRPTALPLLSTALVGTWERRRGDRLTLAGYLAAGGVAGAVAQAAEAAWSALDDAGRETARRLLLRLADTDDGGAPVRRPRPVGELGLEDPGRRAVVDAFVARRLLAVDGEVLDVVHEALLTAWPRLSRWLEEDAAGRAVRRHLAPAAREWSERGEPDEELYRGARLAAALEWAADADVAPAERRFLDVSRQRADAELTDARARLDREVAARRRTRRLAAGLAAVLAVALVAAGLAVTGRSAAERASRAAARASLVADANRLAALSATVGPLDVSALLAAEGYRLAGTPEAEDALFGGLVARRRAVRATSFTGNLFGTRLAGGRVLVVYAGRRVLRWDLDSPGPPEVLVDVQARVEAGEDWDTWLGNGASPTDDRVVTWGATATGEPWIRLVDGAGHVDLLPGAAQLGGDPVQVSYAADGRLLEVFVAGPAGEAGGIPWRLVRVDPSGEPRGVVLDGTLPGATGPLGGDTSDDRSVDVLWSREDPARVVLVDRAAGRSVPVSLPARDAAVAEHRALSSGAAVLWDDGAVTLVDRTGAVVQDLAVPGTEVADVALAPDGSWAVTVGQGGVVLWDVDPATGRWSLREVLTGHAGDVLAADVDASGERLVTTAVDNTIVVWDVRPDGGFGTPQPGTPGRWPAGAPAVVEPGRLAVLPTRRMPPVHGEPPYLGEETVEVAATFLDPRTGEVVGQVPVGDTVADAFHGASAAVSPDGRWVAVTSGLAATVLDARTRAVVARVELPPSEEVGLDDRPYPAGTVCCAAWTPDGSRLLLGAGGHLPGVLVPTGPEQPPGEIAVVDAGTWRVVDSVPLELPPSVLRPDGTGRLLAVGLTNGTEVLVLDAATLAVLHRAPLRVDDSPWALAFSGNGRWLAAAGESGRLHVVDTRTWRAREPATLRAFGATLQLGWLADDRTVVATGHDGTAVLFDVRRGVVRGGPLPASPDGAPGYTALLPGNAGELVLVADDRPGTRYPLDPAVWLRAACDLAGRDLTRAEWSRYLPGRPWAPTCSDLR
ncbi:nSTAND1 domain-containing NTPase [Geodermatophilus sp. SYSU D00766]